MDSAQTSQPTKTCELGSVTSGVFCEHLLGNRNPILFNFRNYKISLCIYEYIFINVIRCTYERYKLNTSMNRTDLCRYRVHTFLNNADLFSKRISMYHFHSHENSLCFISIPGKKFLSEFDIVINHG